jgi:hypothetical protein
MKRVFFICLLSGIILINIFAINGVVLQAEEVWNPAISEKLLSLDWGDINTDPEARVIMYLLRFEEIDLENSSDFEAELGTSDKSNDSKSLDLITDEEKLKYIEDDEMYFSLKGWRTVEGIRQDYGTRLMTVNNRPVSVKLEKESVGTDDEDLDREISSLGITFKPSKIAKSTEKIFTDLKLEYKDSSGILAKTKTKNWIGKRTESPLAIVSYQLESDERKKRKYFALYVTAATISPEKLGVEAPFISVGDIKGLNEIFTNTIAENEYRKEVKFYISNSEKELKFEGVTKNKNRIYADLVHDEKLSYNMGLDYFIYDGLSASGRVSNFTTSESKPGIYLGLSDQVNLKDNIVAQIYYWPLAYEPDKGRFNETRAELIAKYQRQDWDFWYKCSYYAENYTNQIGLSYKLDSNLGISTKWSRTEGEDNEVSLGVEYLY